MKHTLALLCLLVSAFTALPATATSLLPLSLEQLATRADLIFYGKVISNEVKKDAQSGQIPNSRSSTRSRAIPAALTPSNSSVALIKTATPG